MNSLPKPESGSVSSLLQRARLELLDLTARNRLLNTPRRSKFSGTLEIADELATEIFRLLVRENRTFTFQPGKETPRMSSTTSQGLEDPDWAALPQPESDDINEQGIAKRHADTKLQTQLTSEALQRRLLGFYHDARTFMEEQGVNILYLSLGMLRWYEDANSDVERYAPLILVPVILERRSASDRFRLSWTGDDPLSNLTLAAKVKAEFGLILPDSGDPDELDIDAYQGQIEEHIRTQPGWEIRKDDITLGFFSFAKFLMYRDLDPATWPESKPLDKNGLICALMREGFEDANSSLTGQEAEAAVRRLAADSFILDADSSQSLAIEEVRRGLNLIIQGPPGTGKSQTIANIIADSVRNGKRVLFVAEKLTALEVVKRRLDNQQLGAICLELHSNKANKRIVLEEIKRTVMLGNPLPDPDSSSLQSLEPVRSNLDGHCDRIATPVGNAGRTVFHSVGQLVKLSANGIAATDLAFAESEYWTKTDVDERESLIKDLAGHIAQYGVPAASPWRGVERRALMPIDIERILSKVRNLKDALSGAKTTLELELLSAELRRPAPATTQASTELLSIAAAIASAPKLDVEAILDDNWRKLIQVSELVEVGQKWRSEKDSLSQYANEPAWSEDLTDTRNALSKNGENWFRWIFSDYRRAKAHLQIIFSQVPITNRQQISLLDRIIQTRKAQDLIRLSDGLGRACFGNVWHGVDSSWTALHSIVTWVENADKMNGELRPILAAVGDAQLVRDPLPEAIREQERCKTLMQELSNELLLDCKGAFGKQDLSLVAFPDLNTRLQSWLETREQLSKWIYANGIRRKAKEKGLGEPVERLWTGELSPADALGAFRFAYDASLLRKAIERHPELGDFDGDQHSRVRTSFQNLDCRTSIAARFETALAHSAAIPRSGSSVGAMGVLRAEMEKRRRHLPIRQLMKHAGAAIQAIKPVFMMSPLSVAQYLEPGGIEFDLLLIDEASQVQPVDALGAIARSKQIVVVGDDKQLPPSRFFSRITSDEKDDDEDEIGTGAHDIESILGLCKARGMPERMLRWHYRSRHQSLIAVSNREFYDNSLFIVPSPWAQGSDMGLRFEFVRNGVFDRGGTATNRIEAKIVAQAIMKHAISSPHRTLGVGTFSMKQKQVILDELELLRRINSAGEPFFTAHPAEPFFVKNLENIQGDERDVVFISVGYAKNSSGYMAMNFGPLTSDGGERSLNVLISRAKLQCIVFSSITAEDIDLERGRGRGVAALKAFLKYAETGIVEVGQTSGRDFDSPFEEEVARALVSHGYDVRRQIGIAGFFIDLAILHPKQPGRYVLGIECDGASYHSMRSVRDRDRLRQSVLQDHGWRIHRIWSLDWFQRPGEQLSRTINAIEAAIVESEADSLETVELPSLEREPISEVTCNSVSVPYVEAQFLVWTSSQPHEVTPEYMADVVARIIEVEGPIHEEEIVCRVRQLWGLARAGSRMQTAVKLGLSRTVLNKTVAREGEFYKHPNTPIAIRDRSSVRSTSLRKPGMLPPREIESAILAIIANSKGASTPELCVHVPRLLGFAAASAGLRGIVEAQIVSLQEAGVIEEQQGMWTRAPVDLHLL